METWANPKGQVELAAEVPVVKLPWTVRSVKARPEGRLNVAGIFHALHSEKRDTGDGDKVPVVQVFRAGSSMGER